MPFRQSIKDHATEDPRRLQTVWRRERANRVGKLLCYSAVILSAIATCADAFWSPWELVATDLVLLFGSVISMLWIRAEKRPDYYWAPLYVGFWISLLPTIWKTGGISSPFFGVGVVGLYVVGTVMDAKNRSLNYMIFAALHFVIFFLIDIFHPLPVEFSAPGSLIAIVNGATFAGIIVCVHAILKTESELSQEFAEQYRSQAQTEAQLKEAQSIARVGSWEWDMEKDIVTWSDELFEIYGISPQNFDRSFLGYLKRLAPEVRTRIEETIRKSIADGSDFSFENKIQTPHGEKFILSRGRTVRNQSGMITKMTGTSQDITDRKKIESELLAARTELERRVEERTLQLAHAKEVAENASQAKMQFLANMSHEIRTPMNSILGFAELLSEQNLSGESAEYLARIRANGTHLMHLIDDILDLSRFEAGQIPLHRTSFSVKNLVNDVVSSFMPALKGKGLELTMECNEDSPPLIHTDAQRLSQILTNLISNAIKFSEKGRIQLNVKCNYASLDVDIIDSGIGISEANQKNLFQPFTQADSSVARRFGGSGLGLALSKRIARALGGDLQLKRSHQGEGSHFAFHIPVELPPAETKGSSEKQNPQSKNLRDKKILLVEDSPDNVFLITRYIKSAGAEIDVAGDGMQGVSMAAQKNYDCILMDIQMPGMDGLEATRRIRAMGFSKPIIALTAHALPEETRKSLEAGCNLHLTKPINKAELLLVLNLHLGAP